MTTRVVRRGRPTPGRPIPAVHRPEDAAIDYATDLPIRCVPVSPRGVQPTMYRGRSGQAPVRRVRHGGRDERTVPPLLDARADGLSVRSIFRRRWGSTSDSPPRGGRSAASVWQSTPSTTCTRCSPTCRWTGSRRDDDQRDGVHAVGDVHSRRGRARHPAPPLAARSRTHPQGVHRAARHLPARAEPRADRRRLAFCDAEVRTESHLYLGVHIREAAHGRSGVGVHVRASQSSRHRATSSGLPVDNLCPRLSFFFRRAQRPVRGSCEVPRGSAMYARLMRDRFGLEQVVGCGSTRKPVA